MADMDKLELRPTLQSFNLFFNVLNQMAQITSPNFLHLN